MSQGNELGLSLQKLQLKPDIRNQHLPSSLLVIQSITPGSPAALSNNIKVHDAVMAVDGRACQDMTAEQVHTLLEGQPFTYVTLDLLRATPEKDVPVKVTLMRGKPENTEPYKKQIRDLNTTLENEQQANVQLGQRVGALMPLEDEVRVRDQEIERLRAAQRSGPDPALLELQQENQRLRDELEHMRNQPAATDDSELLQLRADNTRLHQENDELSSWVQNSQWDGDNSSRRLQELANQNEQLKKQLRDHESKIVQLQANQRDPKTEQTLQRLQEENNTLKQDAKLMKDERERLKRENDALRSKQSEDKKRIEHLERQNRELRDAMGNQLDESQLHRMDDLLEEHLSTRRQLEAEHANSERQQEEIARLRSQLDKPMLSPKLSSPPPRAPSLKDTLKPMPPLKPDHTSNPWADRVAPSPPVPAAMFGRLPSPREPWQDINSGDAHALFSMALPPDHSTRFGHSAAPPPPPGPGYSPHAMYHQNGQDSTRGLYTGPGGGGMSYRAGVTQQPGYGY